MAEVWKDIIDWSDKYQISDLGNVFSFEKGGNLIPKKVVNGYLQVGLRRGVVRKWFGIHRLVALAFVYNDDPVNKTYVHHIDEDKTNNNAYNLKWVTPLENSKFSLHRYGRGENHKRSKLNEKLVLEIRNVFRTEVVTHKEIGKRYGLPRPTITDLISRKTWRHI